MLSSLTEWLGAKPTLYIIVFGTTRKETSDVVSYFLGGSNRPIKRNNTRVYDTPIVRIDDNHVVFVEPTQFPEADHYNHRSFATMGENVKVYLENIPDKSHVRISAIYAFSVDSGHGPSLFVQRKVRYIYELCRNLDVHRFRIVPVAEKGSLRVLISDSLFSSHEFLNTVDYARWKDLVMPPNLTTFSGMLTELLASNRSNLETHPLDGNDLISMLERQDHDFLDRIQAQMQRNAIEIQRLGRDRDDGRREIAATKRAMEEDSVAHRALLSHLNLHDNHELSSIKDDFARLNNQINHYSTELSQSLVDYSSDHLNVLDCSDPKRLEAFMEISHLWGFRDAIKLGRAVSASLFLDFAISSIICGIFHRFIFRPFYPNLPLHPAAANSEERLELSVPVISKIYRELRLRDPQMQAAKWRSDTFTMLTNLGPCYETKLATEVSGYIQALQNDLVSCFVDPANLPSEREDRIQQLTKRAFHLNQKVKTEVLRSGDLCTLYISSGAQYDEKTMSVLDSGEPSTVLSTYGLGLSVTNAVGGGREPESEIVIKAQVVCESTIM